MKVEIDIDDEKIANCLDNADIAYWGDYHESSWATLILGAGKQDCHEAHLALLRGEGEIAIEEDEAHSNGSSRHALNGNKIEAALKMIAEKWPFHFKDIIEDNSDATTGDVLIQVAIFEDIIYG